MHTVGYRLEIHRHIIKQILITGESGRVHDGFSSIFFCFFIYRCGDR